VLNFFKPFEVLKPKAVALPAWTLSHPELILGFKRSY